MQPSVIVSQSDDRLNPWIMCSDVRPDARLRLICFPYAGGNAGAFRQWSRLINADIEVLAIQYPGRATRFKEKLMASMDELVEAIYQACKLTFEQKPYVFFGHSMGASVAWELCHQLSTQQNNLPELLMVSGRRAPRESLPRDYQPIHNLPKDKFLERLQNLNGTPEEVLQHRDLMELMEPIIRNDFKLIENWQAELREPLNIPIQVMGGVDDQHLSEASLHGWSRESLLPCDVHLFSGDHFYLHTQEASLIEKLNEILKTV